MMKRGFIALLAFFLCLNTTVRANEGMWLPLLLNMNEGDMQKLGLKLSADQIYSVNHSSLKDAIVSLGGFCTGEIISAEGLILTNHHCGYGSIQSHSSVENDYLTDGFWAMNRDQELPNDGLFVRFLVRMEDVSAKVNAELNTDMTEEERAKAIAAVTKKIAENAKGDTNYDTMVKEYFEGNEFYLLVYETYTDIRLVGAPPESVGKYGGDTDNWMWPRHTGDFSLFRVYSGPDGKPAPYAKENIPLKPKHHLPVSLQGVQEGDFAMVMGYPGSTDRYLTSFGIKQALEQTNPTRVKIREERLRLLKEDMDANKDTRIKYASKYASVSNYWKYFIGQSEGLEKLQVLKKKQEIEKQFTTWATANADRKKEYGEALALIEESYANSNEANLSYLYLIEAVFGSEIIRYANGYRSLEGALKSEKPESITESANELKERAADFYKDYNAETDKKVMAALMQMYYNDVPKDNHPDIFKTVEKKYKGNFEKWVSNLFDKSVFASENKAMDFLNKPDLKTLQNDPAFVAAQSFMDNYYQNVRPNTTELYAKRDKGNRLFVKGMRLMMPDRKFYPNANSTMRLTYGTVGSYEPRDAVEYEFYTTMEGVMEKMDNSDPEFVVPDKLVDLYNAKDYGQYTNSKGELPVAFITNNDITGGNSGSPVIDGEGRLIGLAFDGNWEAMSGDIAFETDLQRCINVDIRYVLFIMDKYAGAGHLVNEMTLVKTDDKDAKAETTTNGN